MEIRLPLAGLTPARTSLDVLPPAQPPQTEAPEEGVVSSLPAFGGKELREFMRDAADLVASVDRSLKFEVVEDAGIIQLQVIDPTDGRVVRKVPSDEVVRLVTYFKDKISDHLNVVV